MRMTPDTEESIRCTASGCSCLCFKPGSVQLRSCDRCGHGWVAHALEKLHFQTQQPSLCGPVEVALPGLVFDLSSLVLYGAQAVPVRLKILLDRLYSVLTPEQVGHILHTLDWSLGDYVRGYMLQFPSGKVLDRWLMVTPEEELLILKQFLRFGETRPIVELMTMQCLAAVNHLSGPELNPEPKSRQANVTMFIERNGGTPGVLRSTRGSLVDGVCCFKEKSPADYEDAVHHFENIPGGQSLRLPFHFPNPAFPCFVPPNKELVPPSKVTQCLRRPKLVERPGQEGGRKEPENDLFKIKADPDKPNPLTWHHRSLEKENTSSRSPSINSSPPKNVKVQTSSSSYPLPSFSSSFLCPLPSPPFPPSLHPLPPSPSSLRPLPSSLCSLPSLSPAGGRKGRVCCGVCGKSFYDKGTLKIHYNAVHLKIKHRCTVSGCTMVFSSLRSRNRHSANPNPRLHTGAGRDPRSEAQTHKDRGARSGRIGAALWQQEENVREQTLRNGFDHVRRHHGCRDAAPPQADSPPLSRVTNQNFAPSESTYRSDLPPPPALLPACTASSPGSPPSPVPLKTERCGQMLSLRTNSSPVPDPQPVSRDFGVAEGKQGTSPHAANQHRWWESGDPMPKKKPRKSSMPVKIEREKAEDIGKQC